MALIHNQTSRQLAALPTYPISRDPLMKWQSGHKIAKQMTDFNPHNPKISSTKQIEQALIAIGN